MLQGAKGEKTRCKANYYYAQLLCRSSLYSSHCLFCNSGTQFCIVHDRHDRCRTLVDTFFPQSVICVRGLITACIFFTCCISYRRQKLHYTCTEIRRTPSQELSNQDPFCRLLPSFFLHTKCEYPSSSYHYTQTMCFFFLAVIVALAASITCVNACQSLLQSCETASDCCEGYGLICATFASRSGLLCIDIAPDDSPFATQHSSNKVCYTSNTLVSQMSTVALVLLLIEPHVGRR
ncbi:uncharacterized protein F5147DRAFT_377442 [Suillus discolor]|uniref:Uncharacterized protein n=1 Tax=Suillus discolor TaxID=1912936 RepID=A0A9P7EZ03_9AGAM|nr:uncharacterized protein F5147DRAFT_377442 [Suillus discolor]KAG2096487.1 hypothetical protein F5147DRAFT_377442 [Suillus discolor]